MAKEYKIFENDKTILITPKTQKADKNNQVVKCFSGRQLPEAIEFFLNSPEKNLILICQEPKELFREFKKLYVLIEAAGGLVFNQKKEILFIYRKQKWDLPKGKIDKGEKKKKAAIREVEEECGIKGLKITDKIINTYHVYTLNNKKVLKKTYWYEMKSSFAGKLKPQLEEDITRAEWLKQEQLKEVVQNTYPAILEVCKSAGMEI